MAFRITECLSVNWSGSMNSEKHKNDILCDIKMQCECVAFPCKEYIFMKDKDPWRWSVYTALHNTEGR